ncbi:hypothetical protein [Pseudomonas segetis]|uniref:Uncharacterized protein n=1 Tax=Pseudomonas segetis TaxID=298908 RepID=A0A239JP27_9PSED|nr:hypothetical protein [Pseudomonas segetis]SNT07597.1 hypothetical protein SAMN05216255_4439 [Pseudomonas segetis]
MVATTQNRNTPSVAGHRRGYPVAAAVLCLAGTIAVIEASGAVKPGETGVGLIAVGIFEHQVDNRIGAEGEQMAQVLRGFARLENSADADAITAAETGQRCYIVDNQTVAKTDGAGTRSVAGIVDHVDDVGVWVLIDPTSGVLLADAAAG